MFLSQVGVIQASTAEMEVEKKRLQDTITDQRSKLDKMAKDYKTLESCKQATDKENKQALEYYKVRSYVRIVHTYTFE